ncbi:MAG TPA: penicillin-binding protein 2 [bacterium]|nr:penicillin-binding protein 2 [bacterium]
MEQEKLLVNLVRVSLAILLLRCFYLQIIRFPYYSALSRKQSIRTIESGIPRGKILDRNGRVLAEDNPCFDLVFVPYDLKSPAEEAELLKGYIQMDRDKLREIFTRRYRNPFDRIVIKKNLSPEEVAVVSENAFRLPGIFVQTGIRRHYLLGKAAAHLLGHLGEISEEQLDRWKDRGLKAGDVIGQDGLERYYDDFLRGLPGGILVEVDALGHHRRILGEKELRPGHDLYLTVDRTFQEVAAEALGENEGCVVAMDPRNGQVLALVSWPAFDPENPEKALASSGKPFLNRVIQGQYPPGSVFKIVTEIAALETMSIEEHDRIECTGEMVVGDVVFHCWKEEGHGWLDINLALPFSCNIFFGTIGMKTGVARLLDYARLFHLGQPTGIDLPGEKSGLVPEVNQSGGPLNIAIGQGSLLTTPLQLLSLVASVANGGNIWKPYVVKKVISPTGKLVRDVTPQLLRTVYVTPETMEVLKRGLKNVVAFGTGSAAAVPGVEVAGKTGTAQRGTSETGMSTHGAFACYAPADNPSLSLVVFLDRGASKQAARIAGVILRKILLSLEEDGSGETAVSSGGTDEDF